MSFSPIKKTPDADRRTCGMCRGFSPGRMDCSIRGIKGVQRDDNAAGCVDFVPAPSEKDPSGLDAHAPGAKLDAGKIMAGVLSDFAKALSAVAAVGTFGARKYSRGGWQHVESGVERYTDALWRHLLAERHETYDADSHMLHAAHLAWNALARLELMLRATAEKNQSNMDAGSVSGRTNGKGDEYEKGIYTRRRRDFG